MTELDAHGWTRDNKCGYCDSPMGTRHTPACPRHARRELEPAPVRPWYSLQDPPEYERLWRELREVKAQIERLKALCPDPMAHERCYCQDGRICWKHRQACTCPAGTYASGDIHDETCTARRS